MSTITAEAAKVTMNATRHENALGELRLCDPETDSIILIPTPTNDPNDPLNWPKPYRVYIAVLVSFAIFFGNFLAAGPTVAILNITTDYFGSASSDLDSNIAKAAYFFTTTALLQGVSNLLWLPLIVKFGRRPVYVASFTLYTAVVAWAGGATSFNSELGARIMMGVASGAAECLAPLTISDLFFVHERGTIMAIYTTALSAGVGCGIVIAGLITKDLHWRYIYWVSLILIGSCTILIIFTFPETRYDRAEGPGDGRTTTEDERIISPNSKSEGTYSDSARQSCFSVSPKQTYRQSLRLFSGIHTQESFMKLVTRPIILLALPPVLCATLTMAVTIGFLVAITSNFAVAFDAVYEFEPWQSGLCFIASPVGAGIGAFFGGRFSDIVAGWFTRRNDGIRCPEMRLPAISISLVTAPLALTLYGVGIDKEWHWIVPTIGLGLLSFSIVQSTNISLVYTIDSYRPIAGELAVTQHAFKSVFGFLLSFYTNPWIAKSGYANAFGAMAGISGCIILMWIPMYIWGGRIRQVTWGWSFIRRLAHWHQDREVGE
ncbi:major facilitator superfamily domain-containing protein [Fusarium avenaceum]|nr:major facilitator superfamily domain-containing protein [Fusarium avenaceum]